MDTKELLQAMQALIQENNKALGQMMDEKLESTKIELRQDMAAQEKRMDERFRSLEKQIHGIDMRLDRDFKEIKGLLKDDYGRVEKNAAKGAAAADSCTELRSTQADHTRALQNHNERITVLEEKAI